MSALAILLPECEAILAPYRKRYTEDGAMGLPGHITVLYPFCGCEAWNGEIARRLAAAVSAVEPFAFALSRLARFTDHGVLYLEPSPCDGILGLIRSVAEAFPNYPPYGGSVPLDGIRPHATIAVSPPADDLAAIEKEFLESALPLLPPRVAVKDLWLFHKSNGRWRQHSSFPLGHAETEP
jgi:2'-5' RNA ligase